MAVTAEEIKVLNVDGTPHVVADLPDHVKRLVEIYNTWRQNEIDAKLEVMKVEGAMRNLSGEIIQAVRAHLAPAETEAEAEVPTTPVVTEVPAAVDNVTSELDEVATDDDENGPPAVV